MTYDPYLPLDHQGMFDPGNDIGDELLDDEIEDLDDEDLTDDLEDEPDIMDEILDPYDFTADL